MSTLAQRLTLAVITVAALSLCGCPDTGEGLTVPVPRGVLSTPDTVDVFGYSGEVNLGYIEPGSRHRVAFVLHNQSPRPLTIRDVKTDCSCTAVTRNEAVIAPGKSTRLDVTYSARSRAGQDTTKAVVVTDDPQHPLIPLIIKADTGLALAFRPRSLDLGQVNVDAQVQAAVLLVNLGSRPVKILDVQIVGEGITADVAKVTIRGGQGLPITVAVHSGQRPGTWTASLDIFTDSTDQPTLSLPIYYKVVGL